MTIGNKVFTIHSDFTPKNRKSQGEFTGTAESQKDKKFDRRKIQKGRITKRRMNRDAENHRRQKPDRHKTPKYRKKKLERR